MSKYGSIFLASIFFFFIEGSVVALEQVEETFAEADYLSSFVGVDQTGRLETPLKCQNNNRWELLCGSWTFFYRAILLCFLFFYPLCQCVLENSRVGSFLPSFSFQTHHTNLWKCPPAHQLLSSTVFRERTLLWFWPEASASRSSVFVGA